MEKAAIRLLAKRWQMLAGSQQLTAQVSAGRAEEAVAPLEAAVKLDRADPVAHYQLSFAYRRVGRSQDAEREMALYRQTSDEAARRRESIRAGILGRTGQEQKAEPPE